MSARARMSRARTIEREDGTAVAIVRWPQEMARLPTLRRQGIPRLLIVDRHCAPPVDVDPRQDWISVVSNDADRQARITRLAARAAAGVTSPSVDECSVCYRGRRVQLADIERRVIEPLAERFGTVIGRQTLMERAWPSVAVTRNALDIQVSRLRRRLREIGLEIRTLRGNGYLLQADQETNVFDV